MIYVQFIQEHYKELEIIMFKGFNFTSFWDELW